MELHAATKLSLRILIFYSHTDEKMKEKFEVHLSAFRRQKKISHSQGFAIDLAPGISLEIKDELEKADIVILLITPQFMASEYIGGEAFRNVIERHILGEIRIVPILIRPSFLDDSFAQAQVLPENGKPLVLWDNQDEGLVNILQSLRQIVDFLERQKSSTIPLIQISPKFSQEDWDALFSELHNSDLVYLRKAFLTAFNSVFGSFFRIQPDHSPIQDLSQIKTLMGNYDNPLLAVQFVEESIEILPWEKQNLSSLKIWLNRVADKYNIFLEKPDENIISINQKGYLLVSLIKSGRVSQGKQLVNAFAELLVTDEIEERSSLRFGLSPVTCSLDEVPEYLSTWIQKTEEIIIPYECGQITVELFLPCSYLGENIAVWAIKDDKGNYSPLGHYRPFLVRSIERALDQKIQRALKDKWQLLKTLEEKNSTGKHVDSLNCFHTQEKPPVPGELEARLDDSIGLRLCAEFPTEHKLHQGIFYEIINSAVPIALWSSDIGVYTPEERLTEFDNLLKSINLTDFSELAQELRKRRMNEEDSSIEDLRLLCDCPDRIPTILKEKLEENFPIAL